MTRPVSLALLAVSLSVALAGCALLPRETPAVQARVEARLADLLAAAAASDADVVSMAPFVVAQGTDTVRRWRAPASLTRDDERAVVRETLAEIRSFLELVRRPDGRFAYEVEEFVVDPSDEGVWHVLRVEFEDGRKTQAEFAFLPYGDTFLLGPFAP